MKTKLIQYSLVLAVACILITPVNSSAQSPSPSSGKKPNILVIFGDDIGQTNISAYSFGVMGYKTPNIDRLAKEGMMFTDYYAEQSCTAGRSSFITGQCTLRTGLSKVGIPAATAGLQARDATRAGGCHVEHVLRLVHIGRCRGVHRRSRDRWPVSGHV